MSVHLLKEKNPYFRKLSAEGQKKFIYRVNRFMEEKYFIGREDLVITDEIRILISASAIQLTFGLDDYMIGHLHTINVFPRVFYSRMFETNFKGLTTQGGVLSLSWDDFREGYAVENDKLNLGLHELAHALNIDFDENGTQDEFFAMGFERFRTKAVNDFIRLKNGQITFLRSYGSRNMHEFFAVCIEHFFEVPEEFKKELPHLFMLLATMLNQDPSNTSEDYALREQMEQPTENRSTFIERTVTLNASFDAQPEEASLERNDLKGFIRSKGIYIAMTTTFIGLFLGIPFLIYFWNNTVIGTGSILIILFVCGALGLFQWRYVKNLVDLEYHQFSMYAFTGFGMCFTNLLFLLNHLFIIQTREIKYDVLLFRNGAQGLELILSGEGNSDNLERNVSTYIIEHYNRIPPAKTVTVKINTGVIGLDMVEACAIN